MDEDEGGGLAEVALVIALLIGLMVMFAAVMVVIVKPALDALYTYI
jgi:hypothetical protein